MACEMPVPGSEDCLSHRVRVSQGEVLGERYIKRGRAAQAQPFWPSEPPNMLRLPTLVPWLPASFSVHHSLFSPQLPSPPQQNVTGPIFLLSPLCSSPKVSSSCFSSSPSTHTPGPAPSCQQRAMQGALLGLRPEGWRGGSVGWAEPFQLAT